MVTDVHASVAGGNDAGRRRHPLLGGLGRIRLEVESSRRVVSLLESPAENQAAELFCLDFAT